MGYKPQKKNYVLEFVDHPGLEIRTLGATLDELDSVSGMNVNFMSEDKERRLELFVFFASKLVSWNFEHPEVPGGGNCVRCGLAEDAPMPATFEGLLCLDMELAIQITIGWANTISRVSFPKELNSNAGGMSGPSIPLPNGMTDEITKRLEALQSPMKLPEPNFG